LIRLRAGLIWREEGILADVVALVDDLFFQSKMLEVARHLSVSLEIKPTANAFFQAVEQGSPKLIILDLNARDNPLEALRQLNPASNPARIIGYLSHVQTALAEEARAAGCAEVMPRSKFTQNLPTILGGAKS
jgi:DNA-binding NarL/FixJ family response regulator